MLKPPKTIDEQISLLKSRNIIIEDAEAVKYFLENNNYYRLMGYAFHLKTDKETYVSGTNISTIIGIYNFDKLLRQLVISLLEDFEISFRTKIAYYLSHKYGSECYHSFFYSNIIYYDKLHYSLVTRERWFWYISPNLLELNDKPARIKELRVYGFGWQLTGQVAEVDITGY